MLTIISVNVAREGLVLALEVQDTVSGALRDAGVTADSEWLQDMYGNYSSEEIVAVDNLLRQPTNSTHFASVLRLVTQLYFQQPFQENSTGTRIFVFCLFV